MWPRVVVVVVGWWYPTCTGAWPWPLTRDGAPPRSFVGRWEASYPSLLTMEWIEGLKTVPRGPGMQAAAKVGCALGVAACVW